jgi:hypothetical protein
MTLKRTKFWHRQGSKELRTRTPLAQISAKRLAKLAAQGITNPASTLTDKRKPALATRSNTGPKQSTRSSVRARSGGTCEWPGCTNPATEQHHRLNRKLDACNPHHRTVTSPTGMVRELVMRMGWLLLEHQDATEVPVATRHDVDPVWLDNVGEWHRYEDGAA